MAEERAYSTEEINKAVRKHLSPSKPVKIGGLDGHSAVLAGLRGVGRVVVSGKAGAFLAAFLDGPEVTLTGSAGDYAGSTMASGRLVIEGTVGQGLCCYMLGGSARVKGRVGTLAGARMAGGLLVLDAPVGPDPGAGMTGGTLVLLRPNHLPGRAPPAPARVVVPRGTTKDVEGLSELEMDHQDVVALADQLGELGVGSAEKVADLLVMLEPESLGEVPVPGTSPTVSVDAGAVVLEVGKAVEGKDPPSGDKRKGASQRFADFTRDIGDRRGGT